MRKTGIRNNLHKLIDSIKDESVLKAVHTILSKQDEIIGYSVQGDAISLKDFRKRIKEASQRVKSGDFISHEILKKKSLRW